MHKAVKENADKGDIKGLKYIFVDCLDVDPTFEKYKEDYEYCQKEVSGLFEKHREITPLTENQREWNYDYWRELKIDLVDNFSKERFEHMRKVAKVIYAEKIKTINEKRKIEEQKVSNVTRQKTDNITKTGNNGTYGGNIRRNISHKTSEEQERENEKIREDIALWNEQVEKKQQDKARQQNSGKEDDSLKKIIGVLLGIAIIFILLIIALNQ